MSLYFVLNTEFSNYYAADMLVKVRRPSLVQRLHRPYAVSYKENPVAVLYVFLPCTCSSAYLFTPRSRVLLENLTGFQLVKKFPAFYGTRRFTVAFKSARNLSM